MRKVGIKRISLAFHVSALTITPLMLPDVTTINNITSLCGSLTERSVQTTTMLSMAPCWLCELSMYMYIYTHTHIHVYVCIYMGLACGRLWGQTHSRVKRLTIKFILVAS